MNMSLRPINHFEVPNVQTPFQQSYMSYNLYFGESLDFYGKGRQKNRKGQG